MNSGRARGYALLFAGMALVGTYVALSKPLTEAFPVFVLATLRFAIASLAMIPWLRHLPGDAALDAGLLRTLFLQSFFGNFLFSITMLYGVSMTSATSAGVMLSTLPAVVALLSWLFLRERLGGRVWTAVAFSVAGIVLLTLVRAEPAGSAAGAVGAGSVGGASAGSSSGAGAAAPTGAGSGDSLLGNLLIFACVCCEATYVILGKKLTAHLSPRRISALINLIGLALMLPFGLWQAQSFDFASVTAGSWALLVFYAISASMLSTWLWLTGQQSVPASHSGVFTIALPLAASLVGVLWLGERFGLLHALAFGLAIIGILLITTSRPTTPL